MGDNQSPEGRLEMNGFAITLVSILLLVVAGCQGESVQVSEFTPAQSIAPSVEPSQMATEGQVAGDVAMLVLRETAEMICPQLAGLSEPESTSTGYTFHCTPAAGHGTSVVLEEFGSEAEARMAFDMEREDVSVEDFHGFPLKAFGDDYPSFPGGRQEYQSWHWQAGRWLVKIRAFDDTPYPVAPDPQEVSEALYLLGIEHALFDS